ncbi:MAG: hypothetical protein E7677_01970 [Ruminococcaceae bacterium]|nr:hypothetical protein [Oscillospiraceae bacterium]
MNGTSTHQNRREAITNLQKYLRRLAASPERANTIPIDGIFESATREALIDFQRQMGLDATGIADKRTWDILYKEYLDATRDEREMQGLYFFPSLPIGYTVALGDTLTLVRIIQLLLLELRASYDIFEDVVESGTFDTATSDAIRDFQRINGLPETGEVDIRTWNRIVREYSNIDKREV